MSRSRRNSGSDTFLNFLGLGFWSSMLVWTHAGCGGCLTVLGPAIGIIFTLWFLGSIILMLESVGFSTEAIRAMFFGIPLLLLAIAFLRAGHSSDSEADDVIGENVSDEATVDTDPFALTPVEGREPLQPCTVSSRHDVMRPQGESGSDANDDPDDTEGNNLDNIHSLGADDEDDDLHALDELCDLDDDDEEGDSQVWGAAQYDQAERVRRAIFEATQDSFFSDSDDGAYRA